MVLDMVLKQQLADIVGGQVKWECPLCDYTSFRIGGPADALVSVTKLEELRTLLFFLRGNGIDWRIIGRGTNLLVSDVGYRGVAIILDGGFKCLETHNESGKILIKAGAGHGLSKLSALCMDNGYSGLEFAFGIPGTVGGAAVMNAGAWGGEMADALVRVDIMTADGAQSFERSELNIGYRRIENLQNPECVVTSATLRLKEGDQARVKAICQRYKSRRDKSQPKGFPNAGSIFKNPQGESAGRLIDICGLKGRCIGGAYVSEKHANFIVNAGNATADDVLGLIRMVQDRVMKEKGVLLEPEVHILC